MQSQKGEGYSEYDMQLSPRANLFYICRKVAVPVPEGLTWGDFIHQTVTKLRISGIKEVFLASVSHDE